MIQDVTAAACVNHAIRTEEWGAKLYQELARKFASDAELKHLFEQLGRDEVQHGEQIRAMGERLAPRLRDRPFSAEQQDYLRAMSSTDAFSREGQGVDVGGIETREDALKLALHLEKATLAWYHAVRDVLGPEPVLDSLVAMERKHVVQVMARLATATILRGLADSA